jgi:menaquinone-dependent protoporphyrinogen IX oxidase
VIFDSTPGKSEKNLEILRNALIENNINTGVGIYFRHDNDTNGKPFNEQISQFEYNQPLNNNTTVAGITNLKIPKFLLKLKWQPKSVLVLAQVLNSNRVKLLTNYCDLVIHYQDKKPLKEAIEEIV